MFLYYCQAIRNKLHGNFTKLQKIKKKTRFAFENVAWKVVAIPFWHLIIIKSMWIIVKVTTFVIIGVDHSHLGDLDDMEGRVDIKLWLVKPWKMYSIIVLRQLIKIAVMLVEISDLTRQTATDNTIMIR